MTPNATVVGTAGARTALAALIIGDSGTGRLTIQSGGTLSSDAAFVSAFVGGNAGSQGTVTVTGAGSTWATTTNIVIGSNAGSQGTLTIADGGTVNSGGLVRLANAGTLGTLNIGAGPGNPPTAPGTLNTAAVSFEGGTGTINFNHTSTNYVFAPAISGNGSVNVFAGTTILTANSTYTGGTAISAGTLQLGNGGTTGSIVGDVTNNGTLAFNRSDTVTFPGVISGTGALQQIGTGTTILTAANTYFGPTTVNAGTLIVNGSIANSAVIVNSGAMLAGTGTVGPTTIARGGTFAPGSSPGTMTVQGNLAFQSGAIYLVQINPATASTTNASGTATLAGTVQAAFAPGNYLTRAYTILTATEGVVGTFDSLSTTGLPAGFLTSLSYTGNSAILNLTAVLEVPGETADERGVAHALDTAFNTGHALPPNLAAVFNLTGGALDRALDELDGEVATGAQQVAFQLMNQFLGIMLDPFVDGRSNPLGGSAIGFAPERAELPDDIALAYAKILNEPPKPQSFEQRWSVWGAGYGGSNRTTGDLAVSGSHDLSARTAGGAAGLDYHLTPDTVVGFALAGGGTNWGLAQGLGTGKSDAFQAGLYGATRWGPAYLAADFAFTNHWMSTDRFAFEGDHLAASFNAQSFGGRVESGYRFATIYGGLTPYAAIQVQSFHTPSYSETDLNGGGEALAFSSRNAHDTRTELGGRFDRLLLLDPTAALTLRARLAWAHDSISDPTLASVFQTLPGSDFIVGGATLAKNSALTSAGAELRLANGVTLLAKFDGEFASHSSTYAGTGAIRYRW